MRRSFDYEYSQVASKAATKTKLNTKDDKKPQNCLRSNSGIVIPTQVKTKQKQPIITH